MKTRIPEPAYRRLSDLQSGIDDCYSLTQLKAYGDSEYKRALSEANVSRYADWMDEAADDIEFWGAYASAYFVQKHKLSDTLADYRNRAALLRKLGEKS